MSTEADNLDNGTTVEAHEATEATEADKINTGALGTLVAVGLFAMISITLAITALVRHDLDVEDALKAGDENRVVTELKAAQRRDLNSPAGYVDKQKGVVKLPIDVAKGVVVNELEHDPRSATPADAGDVQVTGSAVDSGASAATLAAPAASGASAEGSKPGTTIQPTEAAKKPEQGRQVQTPTQAPSSLPATAPSPSPTDATRGAQSPGSTKK